MARFLLGLVLHRLKANDPYRTTKDDHQTTLLQTMMPEVPRQGLISLARHLLPNLVLPVLFPNTNNRLPTTLPSTNNRILLIPNINSKTILHHNSIVPGLVSLLTEALLVLSQVNYSITRLTALDLEKLFLKSVRSLTTQVTDPLLTDLLAPPPLE